MIGPVALFILWNLVVRMGFIKPIPLPTPMATLETLVNGLAGGKLLTDFAVTVMRTLQSFLIGSALALPASLADRAYASIKQDIFAFRLIPGDRFSENAVAKRLGMSRTPVRDVLSRLHHEGYVEVHFRNGWSVRPFDFEQFEHLYDLRMVLETTAVWRLCENIDGARLLCQLEQSWLIPEAARYTDDKIVADMDEAFHAALVSAAGNPEIARVHHAVTERICIVRRLDFTKPARIDYTDNEHAHILRAVLARQTNEAVMLLCTHINASKAEVREITLHRLYEARKE